MGRDRNLTLVQEYPWLDCMLDDTNTTKNEQCITWIDMLPQGWSDLIKSMCKDLKVLLDQYGITNKYRVAEAKEKWGMLRWYDYLADYEPMPDDVIELVQGYEAKSLGICMVCGRPKDSKQFVCDLCAEQFNL